MRGGARLAIGVLAVLTTAVAVPVAQATEALPAGEEIEATSVGPVSFLPSNGNSEFSVVCQAAFISWSVTGAGLNANNVNQLEVGALSTGPGGVLMEEPLPPAFEECGLFEGEEEIAAAPVVTPGNWTLAVSGLNPLIGFAAVGIPGVAAKIALPGASCQIVPTTLFGTILNEPNLLVVDGQLEAVAPGGCEGFAPRWQFEGTFEFNNGFAVFP